jgi:hypothetical protein
MRSDEQFLTVRDAELVENAGEVMPNRNARNAQAVGDVLIGKTFAD